ncbi:MAG TPA: alpha/beta hydrolase [Gemmatimonadaceae bacterium]|nr:alpha/beta hydrolase [Gemmatimonadaceae bacterium]
MSLRLVLILAFFSSPLHAQARPALDTSRPLVLRVPGADRVQAQPDLAYRTVNDSALRMDLYLPRLTSPGRPPVVVLNSGASDARKWQGFVDLARIASLNGIAAVNFAKRYERGRLLEGADDLRALLTLLREKGDSLGVDGRRVCIWGFSGGGLLIPVGMTAGEQIRCLVGYYPAIDLRTILPMLPEAQRDSARRTLSAIDLLEGGARMPPMLLVRAGRDRAELNEQIERVAAAAAASKQPVELIEYPNGQHGFDVADDTDESRAIIRRTVEFVRQQLGVRP